MELPEYALHSNSQQATDPPLFNSPSNPATILKSPHSTHAGLYGEYIGPASGVSFLQRVQKRLGQSTSFSHPDSIFTFGDAVFRGSTGALRLNSPVVGMAATPSGRGYWLVAADGGVFSFGDAAFRGSAAGRPLPAPVAGIVARGGGYVVVGSDGTAYDFRP